MFDCGKISLRSLLKISAVKYFYFAEKPGSAAKVSSVKIQPKNLLKISVLT